MYVLLGATGHTGSAVAKILLDKGKKVRVVGRDAKKLASFASRGADTFISDLADSEALTRAFTGAQAIYAMIPPNLTSTDYRALQDQTTNAIATAIGAAGITHAVTLSSVGADKLEKTGPVAGLHYMESRFSAITGLNVLHLRAAYFMENTLAQTGMIQSFGMMAGPVRSDLSIPMIAAKDIGAAAAEALLRLDFQGSQTQELLGPRDMTYLEVARIVGVAIGKPAMAYVQLPQDQVIQAMTGMGISKNVAKLICEMSDAMNSGYMRPLEQRSEKNTTPTTFDSFVKEAFLPAYRGLAASA